jgi:hypothetical protein
MRRTRTTCPPASTLARGRARTAAIRWQGRAAVLEGDGQTPPRRPARGPGGPHRGSPPVHRTQLGKAEPGVKV